MPATWRDRYEKAWPAKAVTLGYLEAFDPDIVVQLCPAIPPYIAQTRRTIVKGTEIWDALEQRGGLAPRYGIGIFEMLNGVYEEFFKYKAKYPVRVVLPRIPQQLSLFWASLFGELPARLGAVVEGRYAEAVEIEAIDFAADRLADVMEPRVLFPRRLTQIQLQLRGRSGFRGDASVYFLDAAKVDFLGRGEDEDVSEPLILTGVEASAARPGNAASRRAVRRAARADPCCGRGTAGPAG
jgi:hypothetical protein